MSVGNALVAPGTPKTALVGIQHEGMEREAQQDTLRLTRAAGVDGEETGGGAEDVDELPGSSVLRHRVRKGRRC